MTSLAKEPVWLDQLVATVVEETPADGAQVTVTAAPTRVAADPALVRRALTLYNNLQVPEAEKVRVLLTELDRTSRGSGYDPRGTR